MRVVDLGGGGGEPPSLWIGGKGGVGCVSREGSDYSRQLHRALVGLWSGHPGATPSEP